MSVRVICVTLASQRYDVYCDVLGDAGEAMSCEGVLLGSFSLKFSQGTPPAVAAGAVRMRAAEVYMEGYAAWVFHNQIVQVMEDLA